MGDKEEKGSIEKRNGSVSPKNGGKRLKGLPQDLRCRVIYSDIDGTLLDDRHHVPARTAGKIRELEAKGIPFILVSARMPSAVRLVQRAFCDQGPMICYSGALVLDRDGREMYSCPIRLDLAVEIWRALRRDHPKVVRNGYGWDLWVVDDDQDPRIQREERITEGKALVGDIGEIFAEKGGIHKFLLMGDPEDLMGAERFLRVRYPELSVLRSNAYYLEVMAPGVGKAQGIRVMCSHYGLSTDEAAVFGDGENDIGMLQAVRYGIAMGNASEKVKAAAAYVTLRNEEEGIYEAIKGL